ncbi:MAG TPA: non-canonical purine NTP pyrophosphatase [Holophaga sp.]|nr:non-canonical purine NTP pyrophosphatase [Holophaga sp.]HPS68337.1 non-canonical purine NTP pyrophosphatase [Holophaga sp.]
MLTLLLASRNTHKLHEFRELLPEVAFVPWPAEAPEIPEDGAFFQDNALQKATFAHAWWTRHGTQPVDGVLADDSGLCVDALWGGPGVLSARFAKDLARDAKNRKLLSMIPAGAGRTARFVCVLALVPREGEPFTVGGSVEGTLAPEPRGEGGFGYDPIFLPAGHARTFGELPSEVKHALSHRGRAAGALRERFGPAKP